MHVQYRSVQLYTLYNSSLRYFDLWDMSLCGAACLLLLAPAAVPRTQTPATHAVQAVGWQGSLAMLPLSPAEVIGTHPTGLLAFDAGKPGAALGTHMNMICYALFCFAFDMRKRLLKR